MIGFLYSTSISADQDNFVIAFRTIKENAKDAFDLIRLVLSSPRFAPEDIARVKQQMVGGLEQRLHLPQPIGKETLQGLVLGENHPYSKRISDRIRKIPEITVEQLQSYMKSSFTQNRMRIVVVGNIGEDDLLAQVNALIQQQPKGDRLPLFMVTPFRGPGKMHAITMDVPQSFVLFAHPGVSRHDPDFYAFFVANSILGGSTFESRLWKEVREKRGLAYGIGQPQRQKPFTRRLI
ncbi:MAG: insulinase family protein [Alphaproteobacteria bacterium]|nr:insulinase family protein [Alphaproteobacteria bacterium]